jgi:hypothetical protein
MCLYKGFLRYHVGNRQYDSWYAVLRTSISFHVTNKRKYLYNKNQHDAVFTFNLLQ